MKKSASVSGFAATTIAFVKVILLAYERYNIDPTAVLNQAQITPQILRDPEAKITSWQMEVFTSGAMRELDDETLGWFSKKLPWGTYGLLCRASLTSPTLGIALRRWFRHHLLLTNDIEITLSTSAEQIATVSIQEHRDFGRMRELCLMTYLRFVHGYACWAIDSRIPLLYVGLPFDRPPHGDIYPLSFPGPVHFRCARAHFSFDEKYLALPHQRDESALRAMLQRPLPLTIHQYRHDRLLVQRIRKLLTSYSDALSTAEDVAGQLHMSSRTMYRQLHDEGTSFQHIKDEVRRERAIELLRNTNKHIKQIALSLGFTNDKSFTRAFRQWTGETPHDFRTRARSLA
jgi:AraC-like DNA-binding protein